MKKNPYYSQTTNCVHDNTCPFKNSNEFLETPENFCYICRSPLVEETIRIPFFTKYRPYLLSLLFAGLLLGSYFIYDAFKQPMTFDAEQPTLVDGENLKKIKDSGVLRVMVESDAAPFNWEEDGRPTGFEFEIISLVAAKLGVEAEIIPTEDYEGIPEKIKAEQNVADVFMGGYVPNPDLNWVEWSNSYLNENGYCLIVREGSAITKISDLNRANKSVLIYPEERARQFVRQEIGLANVVEDEDSEDRNWLIRHLVDEGDADAAIYDYPFASQEIRDANVVLMEEGKPKLKMIEFNLNKLAYSIGVSKDLKLLAAINRALGEILNSPEYPELVKKYLDFDRTTVNVTPIPENVKTHVVQIGETLSIIARNELGNFEDWTKIWELNESRIPNPDLIRVGDVLIMP